MLKKSSWIVLFDEKIFGQIDAPVYETRYPVLSPLYISKSEKEKIQYHMTDYGTSSELSQLLTSIGFSKIEERQNHKWVLYIVIKRNQEIDRQIPT